MRTTVDINDQLLISAKQRAIQKHISLARVIEDALRESLSRPKTKSEPVRLLTTAGTGVRPGIDLDNGRSLLDIMDKSP